MYVFSIPWIYQALETVTYCLERTAMCRVLVSSSSRRKTPHNDTVWSLRRQRGIRCTSVHAHIYMYFILKRLGRGLRLWWRRRRSVSFWALHFLVMVTCIMLAGDGEDPMSSAIISALPRKKRVRGYNRICLQAKYLLPASPQAKVLGLWFSAVFFIW